MILDDITVNINNDIKNYIIKLFGESMDIKQQSVSKEILR